MMRAPHKGYVAVSLVMAGAILPPIIGLWPIPSSVRQTMPGDWAMLWSVLTCVAWVGVAVGNVLRLRLPRAWWPVIIDMGASALTAISCLTYAVALAGRFESLPSTWSIAPFVAITVWQGARAIQLWRDILRVAADE